MPDIKRDMVVSYTPKQMYDLVNDVVAYPQFLPWCSASEVLKADEDEVEASVTVSGAGFHKSFTTCNRLQINKMIEIRLLDGPFKHLEGFWLFQELDDPKQCKVSLDLEFEMSGGMLDFAFGPIFSQVANSLVDAFHGRAQEVYGTQAAKAE